MEHDYNLLARVYEHYRRFLNPDLPEGREIARILNMAGNCDVASMEQEAVLAMFPEGEEVVMAVVTVEVVTPVDDLDALVHEPVVVEDEDLPEPPKRGRRKAQEDSTDESGE